MDPFYLSTSSDQDELHFWGLSLDPSELLADDTEYEPCTPLPPANRSAISRYTSSFSLPPVSTYLPPMARNGRNIHRRIIELLQSVQRGQLPSRGGGGSGGSEGSRGFRHMMRERQRRERLSQSYADLYALLSPRTKGDKNSIVQTAAALVRELKGVKEGLKKRNEELMLMGTSVATADRMSPSIIYSNVELREGLIAMRTENSSSAIDSVIGALRCLEHFDVKARAISSEFSANSASGMLSGVMTIESDKRSEAFELKGMIESMLAVEGWTYSWNT